MITNSLPHALTGQPVAWNNLESAPELWIAAHTMGYMLFVAFAGGGEIKKTVPRFRSGSLALLSLARRQRV